MSRRTALRLGLISACVALFIALEPSCVLRGWLRGESCYQGLPTSYWARQIERWHSPWSYRER